MTELTGKATKENISTMNNDKELCERLLRIGNIYVDGRMGDGCLVNPDGPEAAARIEALNARVEELEAGFDPVTYATNPKFGDEDVRSRLEHAREVRAEIEARQALKGGQADD